MEMSNIVAREKYNICYTHIEVMVLYVSIWEERARKKVAGYSRKLGQIKVTASTHAFSPSSPLLLPPQIAIAL